MIATERAAMVGAVVLTIVWTVAVVSVFADVIARMP